MTDRAKPRVFRGLRDLLPGEAGARQRVIETIRAVYELYGFAPLETPAIEYLDVLSGSGGQEIQESIDPERAKHLRESSMPHDEETCTMCAEFCAIKKMRESQSS